MVSQTRVQMKTLVAEFVAMTLFIYVTCGTVVGYLAPRQFDYKHQPLKEDYQVRVELTFGVVVPLVFGLTILVLAYATAPYQAGQLNPAVSIGLFVAQKQGIVQTLLMIGIQFCGSLLAVGLLTATIPNIEDSGYAANSLSPKVSIVNALVGEAVATFLLVTTVLQVVGQKSSEVFAPIAIGFAVLISHFLLLSIDGCSINPARSFGPAVASGRWDDFWVFVVGPILGGVLAAMGHLLIADREDEEASDKNVKEIYQSDSGKADSV